ncbi:hypothetical protein Tco_1477826, partial [Tanacetum coccineum]
MKDSAAQLVKGKPFESFISRSYVRNQPWLVLLLNPTTTSDATWPHSGGDMRQPDRPLTRGNPTRSVDTLTRPIDVSNDVPCGSHFLPRGGGCPMTACHVATANDWYNAV